MTIMIEADNLTKHYGNFIGIENINFSVEEGEILGLLGPNGAGKTTCMRILTGFMPPSSGTARISGYDITTESLKARQRIGYLPETVPLYTDMTVSEYLSYMGTLRGMPSATIKERLSEVIETCGLQDYEKSFIANLSKGYRQRVGIGQAILHDPDVLILDEPTIGIDPIQVVETRQLIRNLGGKHTLVLSSHILPEVSMVCDRVIIIHEGQVVAVDTPANLSSHLQRSQRVSATINGPSNEVMPAIREITGVQDVHRHPDAEQNYLIEARMDGDIRESIAQAVVGKGWGLLELQSIEMSLEEIFLELTTTDRE